MRDRHAAFGEQRDLVIVEVHRVHGGQRRSDQPESFEADGRTHAVLGDLAPDLVLGLVQVDLHRQAGLPHQHAIRSKLGR